MVKTIKEACKGNLPRYISIALAIVIVVGIIYFFVAGRDKGPRTELGLEEFPSVIGNFNVAWRSFTGFNCASEPVLSVNANTHNAIQNVKVPRGSYLECWYKVGSYEKTDVVEDAFSELIGTFNPYGSYDVSLCCQMVDLESWKITTKPGCKTEKLDAFCK